MEFLCSSHRPSGPGKEQQGKREIDGDVGNRKTTLRWSGSAEGEIFEPAKSRPRGFELDVLCALKNASTYGINNSIVGQVAICGGVLE